MENYLRQPAEPEVPDVPVAFVANSYLDELTERIRSRPIPWEGYQRASLISETELGLLRCYDRRAAATADGARFAALFVSLLGKLQRVDTIQYILVLTDDTLDDKPERAHLFLQLKQDNPAHPYQPFFSCLNKDDEYVAVKASKILTFLICVDNPRTLPEGSNVLIRWLSKSAAGRNPSMADISIQLLASLLRVGAVRQPFFADTEGMGALIAVLKSSTASTQSLYQCCFCIWLLTFDPVVAGRLDREYDVIPLLVSIAKAAVKEKIIRIIVATFRNMVEKAITENIGSLLSHRVLPFTETLSARKWTDEEIPADLEVLREALRENLESLSSLEEYVAEVKSGKLDWTPVHRSEAFWKNDSARFNDNSHELLKSLCAILQTSTQSTVLAVAAHDIGEYVRVNPLGKRYVEEFGAKQRIMELMGHEDPEVRYEALVAVQKYMVNAWD